MVSKKIKTIFWIFICFSLVQNATFGTIHRASKIEKQEYKQERARIKALEKSFKDGPVNDLKEYEKFADEIQSKWVGKNKEHYANLMLEICGPLSSGRFNEDRQYALAREYALSALEDTNEIPLETELELIGHVISDMVTPRAPKGEIWSLQRKKDVEVRLHAWKRLIDAIDPNWDPNEILLSPNAVAASMGFPGTIDPEGIKDPNLRAEYEAAIQKNRQKIERYSEQNKLHKWLKRFPKRAEEYIILAYSKPPFNLEELKQYLEKYILDVKVKDRILSAVIKNMENQSKDMQEDPNE